MKIFKDKPQRGDLIEIRWVDSVVINGTPWRRVGEIDWGRVKAESIHKTAGYLIEESSDYIITAQSRRDLDKNYVGITIIIPKPAVIEIKNLK